MLRSGDELQIAIRDYEKNDFESIQELNAQEGWTNLVEQSEHTEKAWNVPPLLMLRRIETNKSLGTSEV